MNWFWNTWTVFRFELGRSLAPARLVFAVVLAVFPAAIVALLQYEEAELEKFEARAAMVLFVLVSQIVAILGALLWATPVVHAELEGRTWTYLAVRPAGKTSILLGKYLTAAVWTAVVGLAGLSLAMPLAWPDKDGSIANPAETAANDDRPFQDFLSHARDKTAANRPLTFDEANHMPAGGWRIYGILAGLTVLACFAYAALCLLLGVIFLRRAMVAAVAYVFVSEFILSWLPATIHLLTFQYHLRALGAKGMGWTRLPAGIRLEERLLFSTAPAWQHVAGMVALTLLLLAAAALILRQRELVRSDEA